MKFSTSARATQDVGRGAIRNQAGPNAIGRFPAPPAQEEGRDHREHENNSIQRVLLEKAGVRSAVGIGAESGGDENFRK